MLLQQKGKINLSVNIFEYLGLLNMWYTGLPYPSNCIQLTEVGSGSGPLLAIPNDLPQSSAYSCHLSQGAAGVFLRSMLSTLGRGL